MPIVLPTIEEYTVSIDKMSFWLCFNEVYNRFYVHKERTKGESALDEKHIDNEAREEFLQFMDTHFPQAKLTPVFDLVSVGYLEYPYLGSIAVDCDENDEIYKALCEKYEDENGHPKSLNAVFYCMDLEFAKKHHKARCEAWEDF